jgi:hypothetical protein
MTRWFYTDPLAAAWMAKHYGMKFRYWRWDNLSYQFLPVNARAIDLDSSKLYTHPDSLHLLEPKVGDVLDDGKMQPRCCYDESDVEMASANRYLSRGYKIIQRSGKPFHWPEQELSA